MYQLQEVSKLSSFDVVETLLSALSFISIIILIALIRKLIFAVKYKKFKPNTKRLFYISLGFCFITIILQFCLSIIYASNLQIFRIILSIVNMLFFLGFSALLIFKLVKLEESKKQLEHSIQHSKNIQMLYDTMKTFKHDFSNIVQTIGGYVSDNDIEGFKKYYEGLNVDCKKVVNLNTLNPDVINNPGVFSLLNSKFHTSEELGIKMNIEFCLDLNKLNMKTYEFTRILGILLDNAIEASKETEDKIINIIFRSSNKFKTQYIIIENSFINKNIDLDKIYEKEFSTKPNNTGIGLWQVKQMLKKLPHVNLYTTTDDKLFKQQLEISF